ncbi:hypothetical protein PUNSTDRAFT_118666 [Punctularia strigosozonata HHB-11173 SS5]|uniref:uncharacterized protein n=1 Tax=Punctularia strigosozonata (strain HHB-11173) TaxID=741275 RepID=UPI0004417B2A|nr:uncharacterized protein PUNSTDRAFT_118666 [Punctularia strigosozonata HHB-11173 SS5]EIN13078.1 hypothetical protein PUNSTDRAFT_118666 [Punctularia strigosozonata HHB-11173 SS5]
MLQMRSSIAALARGRRRLGYRYQNDISSSYHGSQGLSHIHGRLDVLWACGSRIWLRVLLSDHHQGYTFTQAQLRSVPPYVVQLRSSMLVAVASDKLRRRWIFTIGSHGSSLCNVPNVDHRMIGTSLIAVSAIAMLLSIHTNVHAQYAALFLAVTGVYITMPVVLCWFTSNLGGHRRRSVGTAWQVREEFSSDTREI